MKVDMLIMMERDSGVVEEWRSGGDKDTHVNGAKNPQGCGCGRGRAVRICSISLNIGNVKLTT